MKKTPPTDTPQKSIFALLWPYWPLILGLIFFTVASNGLNLVIPRIIATAIDTYAQNQFDIVTVVVEFAIVSLAIFAFTYLQNIMQTYTSERVARDLRTRLIAQISLQDYNYIQGVTSSRLLTNLTSDVDSVKSFVSQAISSIISSIFLIIGASVLLLLINWRLALAVLLIVPIIGVSFSFVFARVRQLFKQSQELIDYLNRVINESILGSALIRILNSQSIEYAKFLEANTRAKTISLSILQLFATLIPIITFTSNLAILVILMLGGHFVIGGTMTLGDFSAFNSYLTILIFPIIIIGFMSGVIAQASASYARIVEILHAPVQKDTGTLSREIIGDIRVEDVSLELGGKRILQHVSFAISPHTRTAIIGPTAAGKTQLLYIITGLLDPTAGWVEYDGMDIHTYHKESFYAQVGLVFQDSALFNLTLRENIAFSNTVWDADIALAIDTAELRDLVDALPDGLDTIVSERGTSLSGGQKQRIMLARALAIHPHILILDDFTARLDVHTERTILENVRTNYPDITLISVTQKIEPIQDYDQIILLMEWEVLAIGTHTDLIASSPEYVQIYNSQLSTTSYEL
jgi:ATP-binding cassette, subfamily B, bacterial